LEIHRKAEVLPYETMAPDYVGQSFRAVAL